MFITIIQNLGNNEQLLNKGRAIWSTVGEPWKMLSKNINVRENDFKLLKKKKTLQKCRTNLTYNVILILQWYMPDEYAKKQKGKN